MPIRSEPLPIIKKSSSRSSKKSSKRSSKRSSKKNKKINSEPIFKKLFENTSNNDEEKIIIQKFLNDFNGKDYEFILEQYTRHIHAEKGMRNINYFYYNLINFINNKIISDNFGFRINKIKYTSEKNNILLSITRYITDSIIEDIHITIPLSLNINKIHLTFQTIHNIWPEKYNDIVDKDKAHDRRYAIENPNSPDRILLFRYLHETKYHQTKNILTGKEKIDNYLKENLFNRDINNNYNKDSSYYISYIDNIIELIKLIKLPINFQRISRIIHENENLTFVQKEILFQKEKAEKLKLFEKLYKENIKTIDIGR